MPCFLVPGRSGILAPWADPEAKVRVTFSAPNPNAFPRQAARRSSKQPEFGGMRLGNADRAPATSSAGDLLPAMRACLSRSHLCGSMISRAEITPLHGVRRTAAVICHRHSALRPEAVPIATRAELFRDSRFRSQSLQVSRCLRAPLWRLVHAARAGSRAVRLHQRPRSSSRDFPG